MKLAAVMQSTVYCKKMNIWLQPTTALHPTVIRHSSLMSSTVLFLGSFLFKINTNVENNIKCMGTQKFSVFIFSVVEFSEWKFFLRIPHALWTLLFVIGPIDKKYLLPVSIMKRKWEVKCTLTWALYPLQIHHTYFKNNNLTFPYFFKSWTSPENSVLYVFPDMSCYYFIENKMRFMQM